MNAHEVNLMSNPVRTTVRRRLGATLASVAVLGVAAQAGATDEFAALSRYLPADANAVVVVNAAAIYDSPFGKKQGWNNRTFDSLQSSPLSLPPHAQRCILAADLNIESLRPDWEAAVATLSLDPSTADVAKRFGGVTDAVGKFEAAWIGHKTCIIRFAPRLFGLMSPASQQEATRWALNVASPRPSELSPYLRHAIGYADSVGTQVILAVDLAGAFRADAIRKLVADAEMLEPLPEDQAAAVLASIQGVRFGVLIGENLRGTVKLDFAEDAAVLAPVAKPLMLSIIARAGGMLTEFNDWNAAVEGKSLSLDGELTPEGMQRLLSVVAIDASTLEPEESTSSSPSANAAAPAKPPVSPVAAASLRYFRAVSKYVDDSQRLNRADSINQAVMWLDNYARKVDGLSTRNVDPELVEYGKYAASVFRSAVNYASSAVQTLDAQVADQQQNVTYRVGLLPTARTVNYGGYYTREYAPYGFAQYTPDPNAAEKTQQAQDAAYQDSEAARQALAQLATDNETVRQKLSERYGLKF